MGASAATASRRRGEALHAGNEALMRRRQALAFGCPKSLRSAPVLPARNAPVKRAELASRARGLVPLILRLGRAALCAGADSRAQSALSGREGAKTLAGSGSCGETGNAPCWKNCLSSSYAGRPAEAGREGSSAGSFGEFSPASGVQPRSAAQNKEEHVVTGDSAPPGPCSPWARHRRLRRVRRARNAGRV